MHVARNRKITEAYPLVPRSFVFASYKETSQTGDLLGTKALRVGVERLKPHRVRAMSARQSSASQLPFGVTNVSISVVT